MGVASSLPDENRYSEPYAPQIPNRSTFAAIRASEDQCRCKLVSW